MDIRHLTRKLSVSPQFRLSDAAELRRRGYRSVVSNRPDHEEPGQPTAREVEVAVRTVGMRFRWLPVTMPTLSQADAQAFGDAVDELPGPVLAFCRSGTRSTVLWALSQAGVLPTDEIVSNAARVGYDLEGLRPRLDLAG